MAQLRQANGDATSQTTRARAFWSSLDNHKMRRFWLASIVVLAIQLVVLLVYSTHLYFRFDVSVDFAHNAQAWYLIGHGNLSPTDTVRITATPFWRDHFDLIIWPLSLLRFIWPQPVVLLWVQDLAIVAAETVAMFWVAAILTNGLTRHRSAAGIVALVALVANSWWYETASFDVHMPPLGLPVVLLAAYSFWTGRYRRALIAAAVSLLFGAVTAELVIVVGLAALCSTRVRRAHGSLWALAVMVVGLAWIGLVNVIGANQASNLAANYGYLAGPTGKVTLSGIVRGVALHPTRATRVVGQRWRALLFELLPTGFLGLITPWGLLAFFGVLVPFLLTQSPAYSTSTGGAFQNLPAMPFIYIGSVMVLTRIATIWTPSNMQADTQDEVEASTPSPVPATPRTRRARRILRGPVIAAVLAIAATTAAVVQGGIMVHRIPDNWLLVSAPQAATLQQATKVIPPDGEVIASYGVMGRFAERKYILTLAAAPQQFVLSSDVIYFVITPRIGNEDLGAQDADADIKYVHKHLGAAMLINDNGVAVLRWNVPSGTTSFWLPGYDKSIP